jgi:hypothetical protein
VTGKAILVIGPTSSAPSSPVVIASPGVPLPAQSLWFVRLLAALARLLGLHRIRTSRLTNEDIRVLVILGVALVATFGGQAALDTHVPAATAATAPVELSPAAHVATAAQVLDFARSQVGTVEGRDGGTPYHRDYGIAPDQPWCAVFVWDEFQKVGAGDLIGPKTAYTPTLAAWFRAQNQWSASPAVGALAFYNWPRDGKDRIQHVGIVESFTADTITTFEANTSNSDEGSQDDGDGVWHRTRPRNGSIVGYGLPAYSLPRPQQS